MKAQSTLVRFIVFEFIVALHVPLGMNGQTPQQTLQQYVADLQSNPNDAALRQKIIALAQTMSPPPAVPSDAYELVGRAAYAIKNANTDSDFLAAADAYSKALQLAPWVADYYFNQGVAFEKAKHFDDAIADFTWYLMAAPNANDANQVRERIGGLKYAKEQTAQQQQAAEAESKAEQERREAPRKLLERLRAEYDGAAYSGMYCEVCSSAGGHGCGCNENESKGSHWQDLGRGPDGDSRVTFPGDGTILISCCRWTGWGRANLRGTPRDGTIEGIAWENPNTHAPIWVRAWGGYGLDTIEYSDCVGAELARPLNDSQYNSAQRYCYTSMQKR